MGRKQGLRNPSMNCWQVASPLIFPLRRTRSNANPWSQAASARLAVGDIDPAIGITADIMHDVELAGIGAGLAP